MRYGWEYLLRRATAADLDLYISGDSGRAAGMLAAASTLALD